MAVYDFQSLAFHVGHNIEVVRYVDGDGNALNVAVECIDCNEVLLDYDRDEDVKPQVSVRKTGFDKRFMDSLGEDNKFPRFDWELDIEHGNTELGYWEWVSHKIEEEWDEKHLKSLDK